MSDPHLTCPSLGFLRWFWYAAMISVAAWIVVYLIIRGVMK